MDYGNVRPWTLPRYTQPIAWRPADPFVPTAAV